MKHEGGIKHGMQANKDQSFRARDCVVASIVQIHISVVHASNAHSLVVVYVRIPGAQHAQTHTHTQLTTPMREACCHFRRKEQFVSCLLLLALKSLKPHRECWVHIHTVPITESVFQNTRCAQRAWYLIRGAGDACACATPD